MEIIRMLYFRTFPPTGWESCLIGCISTFDSTNEHFTNDAQHNRSPKCTFGDDVSAESTQHVVCGYIGRWVSRWVCARLWNAALGHLSCMARESCRQNNCCLVYFDTGREEGMAVVFREYNPQDLWVSAHAYQRLSCRRIYGLEWFELKFYTFFLFLYGSISRLQAQDSRHVHRFWVPSKDWRFCCRCAVVCVTIRANVLRSSTDHLGTETWQ